jgi:hypothetical protein
MTITTLERVYLGTQSSDIMFTASIVENNDEQYAQYSKFNYTEDTSFTYKDKSGWLKAIAKLKKMGAEEHPSHWY